VSNARLIIGDTRDVTATLEDGSVDLILTSPPFLALRSYLPDDHPDKGREIGSEATPADFLDVLLDLTVEWRRILAPHGSLVVELGDTYSGSTNDGGPQGVGISGDGGARWRDRISGSINEQPRRGAGWPLAKSLCGIPDLYQQSLAYGRNLLRPEHTIEPWRIRSKVAWCRPNPPVGALGDKYRPATSYMTVACVSGRRYFDLDAVRETLKVPEAATPEGARMNRATANHAHDKRALGSGGASTTKGMMSNPAGAPPLDWWEIPTHPYPGSHYATWPPALLVKPILSMCPQRVCRVCGKPSERIMEAERITDAVAKSDGNGKTFASNGDTSYVTLGWTDCGHNAWRNGIVLDPFAGSGTTLAVATGHGRDALGIDIDSRNADLAVERCGMFLTVEHHGQVPA